ncbi:aspartate kinase [Neobacillus drentensis]|uniref:aspartate kinase n=1 Tax=Neobacillus drentensis TaxID=220684 RepID=UPI0030016B93
MGIIVQKFGGTSVGSVERILKVAEQIITTKQKGNDVVVVVSAMGKSTDLLIETAKQICAEIPNREMDMLLSTGELVSISLLAIALRSKGFSAISLTGWQAGILTDSFHSQARIEHVNNSKILTHIDMGQIVIVAGFQGITTFGEVTTLGRGGSDTTAVALAASLNADLCEIYTDVDGVYSADPRIVPSARKIKRMTYDEMLELATLGAGVLHPRAVRCAKKYNVRLTVASSFSNVQGTFIEEEAGMEKDYGICGVTYNEDVVMIKIENFPNGADVLYSLFALLMQSKITVDFINQSSNDLPLTNISFTVSKEDTKRTLELLEENKERLEFNKVNAEFGAAKVSIVGTGLISEPEIIANMFKAFASANVLIKMINSSEIKISCIISAERLETAVQYLHTTFGLDTKEIAVVHR